MKVRNTVLSGLAVLLIGCGHNIEEKRTIGSQVITYGIATETIKYEGDNVPNNYVVLYCINTKDRAKCVPEETALADFERELDKLRNDAIYEARAINSRK